MAGGDYSFKVKVKTIGVEKANTIAIYETNGTVFNGHYQTQERMNIIQLYINDSGSGTPFEEGLNTIVIPTSLFTETVFNAHVQNETLNATAIYSSDEDIFKFISVGRDGKTEQACEEIDFVIIRFDISSQDAMEILDLLLTCLVNETTNETAKTYSYVSTKQNGTTAVMMNLPHSVLGLISWFCNFSDSDQGSKPKGFKDWLLAPLEALANAIIGVVVMIGMAFVELWNIITDFFVSIFLDILPILAYILWLIIRVLILVFAWIILIIALMIVIMEFMIMVGMILTLSIFIEIQLDIKLNKVAIEGDIEFIFGYNINTIHNEFFKLNIPTLEVYFESDNISMTFELNIFLINIEFSDFPKDLWDEYIDNDPNQSSGNNPKSSSSDNQTISYFGEIFLGFGDGMGHCGLFLATLAGVYGISEKSGHWLIKYGALIIGGLILVFEVITFIITTFTFESDPLMEKAALLGYGLGCLISGFASFFGVIALPLLTTLLSYLALFEAFDAFFDIMGIK
jgi:hypothetical protein